MSKRILTGDKLVESVRNRAMIPNDTSVYTDTNILTIANEELDAQLLSQLLALHEEHLTVHIDIPANAVGFYDIPSRAIGNKIRDVVMIKAGQEYEMTQISIGELSDKSHYNAFYVESDQVKLVNAEQALDSIRIYYYIRPNYITKLEEAAIIQDISTLDDIVTINFSTTVPDAFAIGEDMDIVGGKTPNKIKALDLEAVEVNQTLKYVKFNLSDIEDVLGSITKGDYVCLAEESPVPNIPTEMQPVLAQYTAVFILEALGDTEGLNNAEKKLAKMVKSVTQLVDDRVELAPKKIKPRHGVLAQAMTGKIRRR